MRFLHISDLHLGKSVHGVSMLENGDQPYWVDKFLELSAELRPDAVAIAGDVYDRGSPSGEAVELLSRLIVGLSELGICVLLTAGNHDSGKRLAFARDILARQNVHIAGTVTREMVRVTLTDEYGPVTFWLMPYLFPASAVSVLGEDGIQNYDSAVRRMIGAQDMDLSARNVIIAHQNVTAFGAETPRGGSESSVGGVGQVDFTAFDNFEYAALGHIHAAYRVGRDEVRYCGSPMCYHFSETTQAAKGPILVELGAKGESAKMTTLTIPPLHPMREIRGPFEQVRDAELARSDRGEYLRLVITDRPMSYEISSFFEDLAAERGSELMERVSTYSSFAAETPGAGAGAVREKSTEELFADFYTARSGGTEPDAADLEILQMAGELLRGSPAPSGQRGFDDSEQARKLEKFLMELMDREALK